jgi:hypothetical protein
LLLKEIMTDSGFARNERHRAGQSKNAETGEERG